MDGERLVRDEHVLAHVVWWLFLEDAGEELLRFGRGLRVGVGVVGDRDVEFLAERGRLGVGEGVDGAWIADVALASISTVPK